MTDKILKNIENEVYDGGEYVRSKTLPEDSIIDEEKSVRWNREEAQRLNNENFEARNQYRISVDEGVDKFREDILDVLVKDYKLSEKVSKRIYNKAWIDGHSEGLRMVYDEALELAEIFAD